MFALSLCTTSLQEREEMISGIALFLRGERWLCTTLMLFILTPSLGGL